MHHFPARGHLKIVKLLPVCHALRNHLENDDRKTNIPNKKAHPLGNNTSIAKIPNKYYVIDGMFFFPERQQCPHYIPFALFLIKSANLFVCIFLISECYLGQILT